jgi:hypothetical protein
MTERIGRNGSKETITRRAFLFLSLWAAFILLIYAGGGYFGVRQLRKYKEETEQSRRAWLAGSALEEGSPTSEPALQPGSKPVEVRVGVYVNRIGDFSLKESGWTADFDLWFRWTGDLVSPGEGFVIVNGQEDYREKMASYSNGRERYERYRVRALLTKHFDPSRFPFGDEVLSLLVEDAARGAEAIRYVADERSSGFSTLGVPSILKIENSLAVVKPYTYKFDRGDPRVSPGAGDVRSRFFFNMLIVPFGLGIYLPMFQALFASVAVALIVFFIKPTHVDPRFGLGVGAFFAAVGNNIVAASVIPQAKRMTLTSMVNAAGFVTILLTLVQSAVSLYVLDTMGLNRLRRLFDRVSFALFLTGYLAVNLLLPLAARA